MVGLMPLVLGPRFGTCICPFPIIFSTKICDKRDDFNFEVVNFPFLHADVLRSASCWGFAS